MFPTYEIWGTHIQTLTETPGWTIVLLCLGPSFPREAHSGRVSSHMGHAEHIPSKCVHFVLRQRAKLVPQPRDYFLIVNLHFIILLCSLPSLGFKLPGLCICFIIVRYTHLYLENYIYIHAIHATSMELLSIPIILPCFCLGFYWELYLEHLAQGQE